MHVRIGCIILILTGIAFSGCIGERVLEEIYGPPHAAVETTKVPAAPSRTPVADLNKSLFEKPQGVEYVQTTGSKIYAEEMNGRYIRTVGKVFNVFPLSQMNDGGEVKEIASFQIWGNPLAHNEPLYVIVPTNRISGIVRDGVMVEVYGFVSDSWLSSTNVYGAIITQPPVYAHNLSVIPESQP